MKYDPELPLMIQSDSTIILEAEHPEATQAAKQLSRFAELVKTPGALHTYRLSPISLWNAAASGMGAEQILQVLEAYSKFDLPMQTVEQVRRFVGRYGLVKLVEEDRQLKLVADDPDVLKQLASYQSLSAYFSDSGQDGALTVDPRFRGLLKQDLIRLGYPVKDLAGYHHGEKLPVRLREVTASGKPFSLRDYQQEAAEAFSSGDKGGSGVVVLPCGAGKTVVGIAALAKLQCAALILTTNAASVHQWKRELLDKTDLSSDLIGEYSGDRKEVRPVTIATYQILTHRRTKDGPFAHLSLFNERDWGLIIYDEVHLLPAPVFRATASIQATRRLGLTATLVREDGREEDVFSLVGPKLYELGWKELEQKQWVAEVRCMEVRVPLPESLRSKYMQAGLRQKYRIAGENPGKLDVLRKLIEKHKGEQTIIIGQYLNQLKTIADQLGAPMVYGEMPNRERDLLYDRFNRGEIRTLVVSKVANFAIDLPDAKVAIQVSGSFGSRQEEAQRLGRILRPKADGNSAYFYSLVSDGTREQEFSMNRQLFLAEQGYRYEISSLMPLETAKIGGVAE